MLKHSTNLIRARAALRDGDPRLSASSAPVLTLNPNLALTLFGAGQSKSKIRIKSKNGTNSGSVLIIVLWVSLGLVAIALYFAHAMTFELRASDNRVAAMEADQAIEGAARYLILVFSNALAGTTTTTTTTTTTQPGQAGQWPEVSMYQREGVPVGDATFWIAGRGDRQSPTATDTPFYGLVDESSKLNLNAPWLQATNLEMLPRMTPEFAAAIIDWRDSNSDLTVGGAESETYQRLRPGYSCKNAPFESVDELRLVFGATTEILYGEDANLNGLLDQNENDGTISLPYDNRDGRIDPGLFEYVTVYSVESNMAPDGNAKTNVNNPSQLQPFLESVLGSQRAGQIIGVAGTNNSSLLQFYVRCSQASQNPMTPEEFAQIDDALTTSTAQFTTGLVNVATAPAEVLACVPGIDYDTATAMVSYRLSNPDRMNSVAWVYDAVGTNTIQAWPYLTSRGSQFTADIAAVGHFNRGYRRTRLVFDISTGTPRIVHRQDLGHLGWALGANVRRNLTLLAQNNRNR